MPHAAECSLHFDLRPVCVASRPMASHPDFNKKVNPSDACLMLCAPQMESSLTFEQLRVASCRLCRQEMR